MTGRTGEAKLVLCATLLGGCGGGAPLLHPAHTLPEGEVTFAAGTSGRFALGGLHRAEKDLDAAAAIPGGAQTATEREAFAKGTVSHIAVAPGVAPFVAARVGLGNHNEAGITYTGRGARIDGRHAFEWPSLALSLGAGATGAFAHPGDGPSAPPPASGTGLRTMSLTSLSGYGLELPVLFGYRTSADVVKVWVGARAGFERDRFDVALVEAPDTQVGGSGKATRYWGGALVGFSVGLAPLEARVEVDAAYESAHGTLVSSGSASELTGDVAGFSVTPAMAISAKF